MGRSALALLAASLGLCACMSTAPPRDREASSEAAIRAAREVGAEQVPQAALHLKLAQEQLAKGKELMSNGDNEEASYTLLRAQADAELALAMARENTTRMKAQEVIDKARAIGGGPQNTGAPPARAPKPVAPSPSPATSPNPAPSPSSSP